VFHCAGGSWATCRFSAAPWFGSWASTPAQPKMSDVGALMPTEDAYAVK
jgi:hypothetical protein